MAWGERRSRVLAGAVVLTTVFAALLVIFNSSRAEDPAGKWSEGGTYDGGARDSRSGFIHPGVLVSKPQLDFVLDKIKKEEEPWHSAWLALQDSRYARLDWQPRPIATVECGYYSRPDIGCTAEAEDAVAAYTHALIWYFTKDSRHAEKSIEILDAWSAVVKEHTNSNAPLQAGWSAAAFVRAAELIKHTYGRWPLDRRIRAEHMFRTVYLPLVIGGIDRYKAGNWELIMLDAAIGIGVFLDDRAVFAEAIARWRLRLRAYVYLESDGPLPAAPPGVKFTKEDLIEYWGGQTQFVDGLAQETCRDFMHTGWGLTAAAHVAETARIQGVDLYAEARERLVKSMEFHAAFDGGWPLPTWLCGGSVQVGVQPLPEVLYNHYAHRSGLEMPNTKRVIEAGRPGGAGYFYAWETLTHAGNPY